MITMLITGTRAGIGKGLAEYFLSRGATVLGCSRHSQSIDHPQYQHFEVDLTDSLLVKRMFRTIRREHSSLDALINNAGTASMNHFMLTPEDTFRRLFELNFLAAMSCTREATKLLQRSEQNHTSIVNISTVAVPWSLEGQLAYAASKASVEQATRVLSKELAPMNIRVNTLGLPIVETALMRTLPESAKKRALGAQSINRVCQIGDIVGPMEFLVSDQSRFITGETIYLGGVR